MCSVSSSPSLFCETLVVFNEFLLDVAGKTGELPTCILELVISKLLSEMVGLRKYLN